LYFQVERPIKVSLKCRRSAIWYSVLIRATLPIHFERDDFTRGHYDRMRGIWLVTRGIIMAIINMKIFLLLQTEVKTSRNLLKHSSTSFNIQ
jgi:hypothetical protein